MITKNSSPNLTSLSVKSRTKHIADILPPLETVIALPVQSLQQLHLDMTFDFAADREGSGGAFRVADLAHSILSLRRLEDVRLRVRHRTLSLCDADIVLIKSAWPSLRRLSLSFEVI